MRVNVNSNNLVQLVGHVSKMNEFSAGKVASISVAVDGGKDRTTIFVETKCFNKNVYDMVKIGQKVQILGHINTGSYVKGGQTVYVTDIIADSVIFLESKAVSEARIAKKAKKAMA